MKTPIPPASRITDGFGRVDYYDVYRIRAKTDKSAEQLSREIMRLPAWATALFRLRNAIVGVFGLKAGKAEASFPVISQSDGEVVSGLPDKHLDFRLSVLRGEETVSLTTVVRFNNALGRVYFFFIKPFHKLIIKTLLKRWKK